MKRFTLEGSSTEKVASTWLRVNVVPTVSRREIDNRFVDGEIDKN
jgi:hypothetical protein